MRGLAAGSLVGHGDDFLEGGHARAHLDEARLPQVTESMTESLGRRPSETAVRAFLGVDRTYLEEAFAAIRQEAGSVEAYLSTLGVDASAAEGLRAAWLEPARA